MNWTLPELTAEVGRRMASLPAPSNGQIRAVPDERNIRYYTTLGLLDRPSSMRGRTALYGVRHAAQVVAIKRLQAVGKTLAEISAAWPTFDDSMLQRISGVELPAHSRSAPVSAPREFWKSSLLRAPMVDVAVSASIKNVSIESTTSIVLTELVRVQIASGISSQLDVARIVAAAGPLLEELARQGVSLR
jgi:DNA-binding transcriptional MerR regulator